MRIIFLLFFISIKGFAQDYIPIDTLDNDQRLITKQQFENRYNGFLNKIEKKYSGRTKRDLLELYDGLKKDFVEEITTGQFVYNTPLNNKINAIYQEIYTKNQKVPKDLNVLLSKNQSLNAYCIPSGTMVVNMGSIYYLENEDQLAAVLCHEIGHYLLSHFLKQTEKNIKESRTKRTKRKINSIRESRYNRSKKAYEMLKQKLYTKGKENRKYELQADSIGYELYKKTKYDKIEMLNALNLLLKYDTITPEGLEIGIYKKVFNLPKQSFQDKWIEQEDYSKYEYSLYEEKFSKDSLKSHPDVVERIEHLKLFFSDIDSISISNPPSQVFKELQEIIKKEQVPNLYFQKKYGFSIYWALYRMQKGYMENYHKKWLGKNFQKIYEARKAYKANRYLDTVNPREQSKSYQQFLNFMWNLKLEEIKVIADYYSLDNE